MDCIECQYGDGDADYDIASCEYDHCQEPVCVYCYADHKRNHDEA